MKLKTLILKNNNIGADGIKELMPVLVKMGSLENLCFATNIVDEKSLGLKILLSEILNFKKIKTLNINGNLGINNAMPELLNLIT